MRRWKAERGKKRRRETVERCDVIDSVCDGFIQRRGGGKSSETAENATSTPRGAEAEGRRYRDVERLL